MKIVILLVLTFCNIYFFKTVEKTLIEYNFSWTLSKAIPYLLLMIFGVLFLESVRNKIKLNKYLRMTFLVIITMTPFFIGFIINPIYEGDFSKQGVATFDQPNTNDIKGADLVVLTIPSCPFCHESTIYCNLMLKRNPNLKIRYIVCTKDTNQIQPYQDKLDKKIEVHLAEDPNQAAKTASGAFPAFLLIQNNKAIQKWSNDQFGVRAKDLVEAATN